MQDLRTVVWHGVVLTLVYLLIGGLWLMTSDKWTLTETVYFMVRQGSGKCREAEGVMRRNEASRFVCARHARAPPVTTVSVQDFEVA